MLNYGFPATVSSRSEHHACCPSHLQKPAMANLVLPVEISRGGAPQTVLLLVWCWCLWGKQCRSGPNSPPSQQNSAGEHWGRDSSAGRKKPRIAEGRKFKHGFNAHQQPGGEDKCVTVGALHKEPAAVVIPQLHSESPWLPCGVPWLLCPGAAYHAASGLGWARSPLTLCVNQSRRAACPPSSVRVLQRCRSDALVLPG